MALVQLSPTKASTWLDCPRRFYYAYVAKQRHGRRWAHLSYGNAVHGALRAWFELPVQQRRPDNVADLVAAAWVNDGFRDEEHAELWKERAEKIVTAYLADLDPAFEPLSTERTLSFKTETFTMQGRIDRLDDNGDAVGVVDYKTGKTPPTGDDVRGSMALAMYAAMVQRVLRRPVGTVSLHHVPSGERVSWQHSPESIAVQVRRMESLATDIARAQDTWDSMEVAELGSGALDGVFPAQPSALCGFCDYWDVCAAGQARADRRESWEGLERAKD